MVVASSADSASFSKTRLYVSCSTCDFFSKWTRNRACASLDELAVGNSDGEVGSVGGGTFGEQPCHSRPRSCAVLFVAEEEAFGEQPSKRCAVLFVAE